MKNQKVAHHELFSKRLHFHILMHSYLDNLDADDHTYGVMVEYIFDAMRVMTKNHISINGFEGVLSFARKIFSDPANDGSEKFKLLMSQWPKSSSQTMAILRMCGYQYPTEYWICFCRENERGKEQYTGKWDIVGSNEQRCRNCGNSCDTPYYYLGLKAKCQKWFNTNSFAENVLTPWFSRWEREPLLKEIWQGKRWKELDNMWELSGKK